MYRKNTAGQVIGFSLVSASTGLALTGGSVTAYRSLDGTGQVLVAGTITETANGQYIFNMAQADTNANVGSFLFIAAGAVPVEKTIAFNQDIITALALFIQDNAAGYDRYSIVWFVNGQMIANGAVTSPVLTVLDRVTATYLVGSISAGVAMTNMAGDSSTLILDSQPQLPAGHQATAVFQATINGEAVTWIMLIGRDSVA